MQLSGRFPSRKWTYMSAEFDTFLALIAEQRNYINSLVMGTIGAHSVCIVTTTTAVVFALNHLLCYQKPVVLDKLVKCSLG
jgi:seryl-tRNA(Sec) selenium transferase